MLNLKTASIAAILLIQANGLTFTATFAPELLQKAFAHETKATQEEQEKIAELRERLKADGFDARTIDSLFNDPLFRLEREIFDRTKVNPEKEVASGRKDYEWYKKAIKLDEKISNAPAFLDKYRVELSDAESRYGVNKRFIVGVLGIESNFKDSGGIGKYKAFNALATLYVLTSSWKDFAYRELKELTIYSKRTGLPIFSFNSSYAGAIGYGQFVPSSLNRFFVGKNGKIEKANPNDMIDCIHSIAYYLSRAGWDRKQNGEILLKGSKNWNAIFYYNRSEAYVRAVIELATSLK